MSSQLMRTEKDNFGKRIDHVLVEASPWPLHLNAVNSLCNTVYRPERFLICQYCFTMQLIYIKIYGEYVQYVCPGKNLVGTYTHNMWLYSCDKSSYIRSVYSQCHLVLLKCTEQNGNNQTLTQISQLYVHIFICLTVIRS